MILKILRTLADALGSGGYKWMSRMDWAIKKQITITQ
jgi:hypothetical protein